MHLHEEGDSDAWFFFSFAFLLSCFLAFSPLSNMTGKTCTIATCLSKNKPSARLRPSSKVCLVNIGSTSICASQNISNSNRLAQLCLKLPSASSTISSVAVLAKSNMISVLISSVPDMPAIRIDHISHGSALYSNPRIIAPRSA